MKIPRTPRNLLSDLIVKPSPKGTATADRFRRYVKRIDGDCHLWIGSRAMGYGLFRVSPTKRVYAHRYAFELALAAIPPQMQVDHVCRVRRCVNPDHLQVVTPEQNRLLHRIRMGDESIYVWEQALLDGLAVEVDDLDRFRRGEVFPWADRSVVA